jgi:putative copper export protein
VGPDLGAGLRPAVAPRPRRLTPADLQTSFGPVPATAADPFAAGYDDPAFAFTDVPITAEVPVTGEIPVVDDAPPLRSRWHRAGWAVRDVVLLAALVLAVVGAWVVLVDVRGPDPAVTGDRLARQLDRAVAASLRADRVASFGAWLVNVTTALVIGGVMFRSFVAGAPTRALGWSPVRILRTAAVVGIVASLAALPFRAAAIAGTGRVAMTDPATLEFVATSKVGTAALLRVAGLLLATFAVAGPATNALGGERSGRDRDRDRGRPHRGRRRRRRAEGSVLDHLLGAAGALLLLASYAWVGHPQAAEGRATLLVLGQMVHVLAVSTWFGGVVLLYLQIRAGRRAGAVRTSAEVVERFSVLAGASLALTAATGLALARSQIASVDALTSTPYGRALALKLGLVALVVAVGAYNKVSVVPRIARMRGPAAWRSLHRTLLAEAAVLAAGVLLATTAMTSGGF